MLLDNGRTHALADPVGRAALRCIRCSACLNVCPVYERTGGHAYGSVYPGPIGAILTPQLTGIDGPDDATPRCRTPRRCAAPATTSARCGSTSRRCWCSAAPPRSSRTPAPRGRSARHGARRSSDPAPGCGASRWPSGPGFGRRALAGRRAGLGRAALGPARPWTGPATCPPRRGVVPAWWRADAPGGGPVSARDEVLPGCARPWPTPARRTRRGRPGPGDRRAGEHAPGSAAMLDLFAERVEDYRADRHRVSPRTATPPPSRTRRWSGAATVGGPAGARPELAGRPRQAGITGSSTAHRAASPRRARRRRRGASPPRAVGIAETGTIVLDRRRRAQGRRAAHPGARPPRLRRARRPGRARRAPTRSPGSTPTAPLTWISGPSRDQRHRADRVEGVHGPAPCTSSSPSEGRRRPRDPDDGGGC